MLKQAFETLLPMLEMVLKGHPDRTGVYLQCPAVHTADTLQSSKRFMKKMTLSHVHPTILTGDTVLA